MGGRLHIHTGNRLERLLDALAARLAAAPLPPLQEETIVVPGQGMARWLTLELARRHGVAASLRLPFPGAFLAGLCGDDEVSRAFSREVLTFRIFRLLGQGRGFEAASTYCQDDPQQHKRMQLAERLAATFDDYQFYRDGELLAFERGERGERTEHGERAGAGEAAARGPHLRWQARLWRALLDEFAPPAPAAGQGLLFAAQGAAAAPPSAHRLDRLRALLDDAARARAVLPPRLSVFGVTSLPPAIVDVLFRIARHVDVDLYVPKATPEFVGDVTRRGDAGHPLLAAYGQSSREFFDLLLDADASGDAERAVAFVDPGTACLLHALQSDLLHVRERGSAAGREPALRLDARDRSLTVHGAHGPLREMEVLRDQILDAFAADPTLGPGDVMVLLADLDGYAPYVHAVFGPVQKVLPFTVADRSPGDELPVPATFLRVLQLAGGRFAAPEVLLLLEEQALARTFGIARPDLPVLRHWVQRARIRWGVDGAQKKRDLALPDDDANSWREGLARLLLGHATGPCDELVLDVLPAGDGGSGRADLLGRFATFVATLVDCVDALRRPHPLREWAELIEQTASRLFTAVADDERQGLAHLQGSALRLHDLAEQSRLREELAPAAFAAWLQQDLAAQGESRGFLTGAITFAALRPMRAVPVRVLAVAGLGDGVFPRREQRPGFDLLQQQRRPGDRSVRDDDRQLFLDALLAARERLILSFIGRSAKDNSECAPSPVLAELLDWLDRAALPPPGFERASDFVAVQHPLQAFSPRYGGGDERLFTYGRRAPDGAAVPAAPRAAAGDPAEADDPTPLAPVAPRVVELDDLLRFWNHPTRFHCSSVLNVRFPRDDDRDQDSEPFALHALDSYLWNERSVRARLQGRADPVAAVRRSGVLPSGGLGGLAAGRLRSEVETFFDRVRQRHGDGRIAVQVRGDGWLLRGTLAGLCDDALVLWRPSRIKGKDQVRAFVHHAVLCAANAQGQPLPTRTVLLGTDAVAETDCGVLPAELDRLVQGFLRGCEQPLPFFAIASAAYAEELAKTNDRDAARRAAREAFEPDPNEPGAHDLPDPCIELCFRDVDPIGLPEFASWCESVSHGALTWFRPEARE